MEVIMRRGYGDGVCGRKNCYLMSIAKESRVV